MADRVVLLDTHALVWWTGQPDLLGKKAHAAVESAARILIPAIVFWEVALLVRKKRLSLGQDTTPARWMDRVLAIPRVSPVPLTPAIAVAADGLEMHPDPADRFIVATALQEKAPIITKDGLLRDLALVRTIW